MSKNTIILFITLICIISCEPKKEIIVEKDKRIEKLESDIQNKFDETGFVGMGIAIIKDDKILLNTGFGHSDFENKTPYSTQTIQPIGSISKLFIGAAIAKSMDLGYFTLETNINEILPFELKNPFHPNEKIKVKHLVTHTSGITDSDLFWSNCYFIPDTTKTDLGTKYIKEVHLAKEGNMPSLAELMSNYFNADGKWYGKENFIDSKPNDTYKYSNVGSSLAAYLVEIKSGIPFNEFCKKHIFKPLKLNNTAWQTAKNESLNATLYLDKNTPLQTFKLSSYPDGGLHTTSEDLSIFLLEMMQGYAGKSDFLSPENFKLLFEKKFDELPHEFPKETNSGIFWDWMKNGKIGHNGADPGLFTLLAFHPEKKTGRIILLNKDIMGTENRKELFQQLKEIVALINEYEKDL